MKKFKKLMLAGMLVIAGATMSVNATVNAMTSAVVEKKDNNASVYFQTVYLRSGITDTLGLGAYQNLKGCTYQYKVGNYYENDNEWYESAENGDVTSVVTVDQKGKITTNMVGSAKVTVTISNATGQVVNKIVIPVVVSDPVISEPKVSWKLKSQAPVEIQGITSDSKVTLCNVNGQKIKDLTVYEKHDENEYVDEEELEVHNELLHYCEIDTAKKCQSNSYILMVDGVKFPITIVTTNPKLKEDQKLLVVKKGKNITLHFTGIDKDLSKIKCNDYGAGLAQYYNKKIKGKEVGTGEVEFQVDGANFIVMVSVQKGKVYKAVAYAAKQVGKAKYSQAKRNKKGYYDCSSLVWRSYKAAGIRIGKSKYPLNSDGLAKAYYKKKGHWVGTNLKNLDKLRSGDIIVRGTIYKGRPSTDHAALYIGNGYTIEAKNEQLGIVVGRATHAPIAVRPVK